MFILTQHYLYKLTSIWSSLQYLRAWNLAPCADRLFPTRVIPEFHLTLKTKIFFFILFSYVNLSVVLNS